MAKTRTKQETDDFTSATSNAPEQVFETKDSPTRSITKAITWRIIASTTTFVVTFVIFNQAADKTMSESLEIASYVGIIDMVAKLFFYYLHERMWANITWGKYWRRRYWRRRAWKKLYRKMHKEQDALNK